MLNIAKGQTLTGTGTVVDVFLTDPALRDGILRDPSELSFAIYTVASGARTKIFPVAPATTQEVDLATNKIGTGHFYASFTMPSEATAGAGELHWWYTVNEVEREIVVPIEITASQFIFRPGYCLLSDVRSEGISSTVASDARVLSTIDLASRYIERVTDRWFEPRRCQFELDGDDTRVLRLPTPLIAIENIVVSLYGDWGDGETFDPSAYRVYARHITTGQPTEDDRDNPKIELVDTLELRRLGFGVERWPRGRRNILVEGVFGYTDFDGSPTGETPPLLRQLCTMLAVHNVGKMVTRQQVAGPITSERTRDQSVTYGTSSAATGAFTADPEIDLMLESFRRPPIFEVG